MTPLAHAIALEMCKPVRDRRLVDRDGIAHRITDFHFFECSAVYEMAEELAENQRFLPDSRMAFLPAPQTLIEVSGPDVEKLFGEERIAILLEEVEQEQAVIRFALPHPGGGYHIGRPAMFLPLGNSPSLGKEAFGVKGARPETKELFEAGVPNLLYALLAMINTPRLIGSRQRAPHVGLQRKIAAAKGMVGKFPLRAWTEIVLEVTPPAIAEGERETRLSGGKALHFCRQHLRIRNGRLELVSAHWRGDAALGLARSRYRIVPPHRRAA